jgi:FkbH-like protein
MESFSQLKKKLKQDFSTLETIRVALLGDTATQFLAQAIRATGFDHQFDLQIWEAGFDQIERQVFDPRSDLYTSDPQLIILFHSTHKLLSRYNKLAPEECTRLAEQRLQLVDQLCAEIEKNVRAKIIYYNYPEIDDAVFGHFANKTETAFVFQLRKLNYQLMEYAAAHANFYLCDLSRVQNQLGRPALFQPSMYINTEMVLSLDALPFIASGTVALIGALYGRIRKCLILDLDNTLWGGVIGDDGMENIQLGSLGIGKAFTEFQYWLKKLKQRGIILAVCSKNTEAIAKAPFEDHPDMVLHLSDIAVFIANWESKVDNIRRIQSILNIGFDSMVFLDDNPVEREMVSQAIPAITIPQLPEDPADYLEYLYTLDLFETSSLSAEDGQRTKLYQVQAQREMEMSSYGGEDAFLQSLGMRSKVETFHPWNIPRVAQLTQRSNQFNLRTVRYTEAEIQTISASPAHLTFSFTLEDRFGDNGIICVVILERQSADTAFIETWLMSCRVLKRGMEEFTLNTLAIFAANNGFRYLKGEFRPTARNQLVEDHYQTLGFQPSGEYWLLDIQEYENKKTYINVEGWIEPKS